MAETKQTFAGLVRINTSSWDVYQLAKVAGKIIFAEVSTNDTSYGKYIWANGIEYKVGDDAELDDVSARLADLSTYVRTIVDTSISDISTRLNDTSVRLNDLSTYVRVTVDTSISDISTRLNETSTRLNETSTRLNETSTRLDDASTRLSYVVKNASISTVVDGSIATLYLHKTYENGTTNTLAFTIKGNDAFVQLSQTDASVDITLKIADISSATGHTDGLATSYNVQQYVLSKLANIANALTFEGGSLNLRAELAATDLTAENVGDTFVINVPNPAEGEPGYNGKDNFTFSGKEYHLDMGDLVIVNEVSTNGKVTDITVVERNLNGAVTSDGVLRDDYVVLGNGNQKVKDGSILVSDLKVAMKNANSALQDVSITTNSSYVTVTSQIVSTSTGKTTIDLTYATLADASNGSTGIAMAEDVYKELTDVEYTMATAITKIGESTGLDANLEPGWTNPSINDTSSHREVIEYLYQSVEDTSTSVVKTIIGENEALARPHDAFVRVDVSRNAQNTYTIDASVETAIPVDLSGSSVSRNASTGLATDGYVKDYVLTTLEWAIIND